MKDELVIDGVTIARGERKRFEMVVAKLFDHTKMTIPVEVIRGKKDGPTMFISAALHGDEINGVEVIRRLLSRKKLKQFAMAMSMLLTAQKCLFLAPVKQKF